jgi:hypothetical protein
MNSRNLFIQKHFGLFLKLRRYFRQPFLAIHAKQKRPIKRVCLQQNETKLAFNQELVSTPGIVILLLYFFFSSIVLFFAQHALLF